MAISAVNGVELYYEELGEGPPVMLITGLGGVGGGWGPQKSLFGNAFRTLIPDHRGRGRSSLSTPEVQTIDQHASDMAETLRRLGTGPVHLVGSSTGGAIAMQMALDHGDVVRSLTLVASFARADEYFNRWFDFRKLVLQQLGQDVLIELTLLLLFSADFLRGHWPDIAAREKFFKSSPYSVAIEKARMEMIQKFNCFDQLSRITVPTLVVVGSHDIITPPYFSEEISHAIKGSKLKIFPGAGHYVHEEKAEEFFRLVSGFIRTTEGATPA
jgi:aminoacrylate hydrolase